MYLYVSATPEIIGLAQSSASVNHHGARHASCLEAPRDRIFTHCLNPLHRFHRIPLPMHRLLESTIADALPLVNAT